MADHLHGAFCPLFPEIQISGRGALVLDVAAVIGAGISGALAFFGRLGAAERRGTTQDTGWAVSAACSGVPAPAAMGYRPEASCRLKVAASAFAFPEHRNSKHLNANLAGASLGGANLINAALAGASYDGKTIFTSGFDPAARGMVFRESVTSN